MTQPLPPGPSLEQDDPPDGGADPAHARLAFLAEAGRLLASSLDYAATLANVARLTVPTLADWCAVDVLEEDGNLRRLAVVHSDPDRVELARDLFRRYPPDPDEPHGVWQVLRTGCPELYPDVPDALLEARCPDAELLAVLRRLGLRSAMLVPLLAGGRVLGVITLVAAESGRHYGPADLALAQELAGRCALALDNARLYRTTQAAEQRYRDLVDGLEAIVWEADAATGRFTFVSRRAEELLGYPAARWVEDPGFWVTLIHPADRSAAVEACRAARREGRPHDCEYRVTAACGREVWLRDVGHPVRDAVGPARRRGMMADVTERRRLEDERRRRAADLAEAARHKDEFLAVLAHELRNPLAPVRNALHVLRARGGDRATREWAQDVLDRQVGHLARMVDDLLDVSRLTRGKIALKRERVDLAQLLRLGVDDHRAALERAGLVLELDLPPTPLWVEGDSTRLAQVLDNLLSNAAKFTPPGGRVTVRLRGGAGARIEVRDTGVGIAPDLLPYLFRTVTQADSTLERSQGGLGLGLALVRGLVELHGGRAEARSAGLGQGAEFVVTLPLERAGAGERPAAPADGSASRPLRILMVEDNRDGAETLQALLQLAGHEVALACTGPDGVTLAHEFHPDVVLCDIGLPGMDGFAVGRALRRDPVTAASRLIVLSGYGQEEDKRKSREAGFDLHLTKPVDPLELQRLLRAQPVGAGRTGQGTG
jgi:PAS domain S-box-containing protein